MEIIAHNGNLISYTHFTIFLILEGRFREPITDGGRKIKNYRIWQEIGVYKKKKKKARENLDLTFYSVIKIQKEDTV